MGLDQYAAVVTRPLPSTGPYSDLYGLHDDNTGELIGERPIKPLEVHYWRKHPDLHGWMQALYEEKGGAIDKTPERWGSVFNGDYVRLTLEDIDALAAAVENRTLPHTEGFFFGTSNYEDKHLDVDYPDRTKEVYVPDSKWEDTRFIDKARAALANGLTLIYFASY